MRRAWIVFGPMVFALGWLACVGDDPGTGPLPDAGNTDTGSQNNDSSTPDVASGNDAGVDAPTDVADANPCAVPPAGDGLKCTNTLTCPKGQRCCNSAVNGQRDCVSSLTGCTGSIEVQCMAKNHCASGGEICCMEANPTGASPSGTCPATINAAGAVCSNPFGTDSGCPQGQLRLCGADEPCPASMSCIQVDVNIGTTAPYRTGYCQ